MPHNMFTYLKCLAFVAVSSQSPWASADDSADFDVDSLLQIMTTEQKVGQVLQGEIHSASPGEVKRYGLGSVLNGGGSYPSRDKQASVDDWLALADSYFEASVTLSNGVTIAPVWGSDAVHGHNNVFRATVFPHNIGLGAAGSPDLVERIGVATAREVKATGIDWVFAPTVAVAEDYRWGRTYESFGGDAARVSDFGAALIKGFESEGVATTAKHFLGDGATESGTDQGNVKGDFSRLADPHLAAYQGAFDLGVPSLMASFNSWNGVKVHGSRELLTDVLRDDIGYTGMVVSDWNGIGQIPGCNNASCSQAFNAGIDMIMAPNDWKALRRSLLDQLASGEILEDRLDEAVRRILVFKNRYGLINGRQPSERVTQAVAGSFGSAEHRALAREAVRKSLVMLKNDNELLPIAGDQRVAVVGSGANNMAMQMGGWTLTWQGTGNSRSDFPGATSIAEGLQLALESSGGRVNNDPASDDVDVAIVVFGEQPYAEGAGDIQNLDFSGSRNDDLAIINAYKSKNIPVVGVFLTGRPLWINPELNAVDALVVAWLPGSEGGGVADLLIADVNGQPTFDFEGKLPFAWPAKDLNEIDSRLPVDQFIWDIGYGLTYEDKVVLPTFPEDSISASSSNGDYVIYRRNSVPPFGMFIGDEGQWVMPVAGAVAQSSTGELTVKSLDVRVQEDARQITWHGSGVRDSQFYFKTNSNDGVDLRSIEEDSGALSIVVNMASSPRGKVKLRMDCSWPCRGELDVTKLFKRLPEKQWVRLSFPLECFVDAGADLSKVNSPLVLVSNNTMSLVLLDAVITRDPDKDSMVPCQ